MKAGPLAIFQRLRRSVWTLPLAGLAALVIVGINEAAYERSTTSLAHLGDRTVARAQIQLVWRTLIDAESGQRSYLLTGRAAYLQPYEEAAATARQALEGLSRYYAQDAQGAPLLAELARHVDSKLSELATTLELHRRGTSDAWRELMLTDIGREKMDSLRDLSQQLLELESQRVDAERGAVISTLRSARLGVSALTALSLLALVLFLRQTLAFERAQREHARAIQAERDRLELEAERRTADLTELARHLQNAREEERSRLARELHDELGALLTAAKLDAARLKRAIGVLSPAVQARLAHLNDSINRGIELKRHIIEGLRPSSLSNLGLVAALGILTREHAARSDMRLQAELEAVPLSDSAQITAYRLVQEALANITKHAGATEVTVTLKPATREGREGAELSVVDDGCGFDPEQRRGTTHGLMGMVYRIEAEDGVMAVHSKPGEGTRIEAWLPRARSESLAPGWREEAAAETAGLVG